MKLLLFKLEGREKRNEKELQLDKMLDSLTGSTKFYFATIAFYSTFQIYLNLWPKHIFLQSSKSKKLFGIIRVRLWD